MADSSSFSANVTTSVDSTSTGAVSVVTTNVAPSSVVSANIITGGKGDPGADGAVGPAGPTDYNLLTNKPFIQKITVATSAPSSPSLNDLWVNSS